MSIKAKLEAWFKKIFKEALAETNVVEVVSAKATIKAVIEHLEDYSNQSEKNIRRLAVILADDLRSKL